MLLPLWHITPCSPREAHGGAGHLPAACGHCAEHISLCSHRWARRAHGWGLKEAQPIGTPAGAAWGGAAARGDRCGAVPEGWALCYRPMMGLGELQTMGSPHRVSSWRAASHGREPTLGKKWPRRSSRDGQSCELTAITIPLYHSVDLKEGDWEKCGFSLLNFSLLWCYA